MNIFCKKLYTISHGFIKIFSFLLLSMLLLGSFLTTCYSTDMTSQQVLTRLDNPIWNLIGTAAITGIILLFSRFFRTRQHITFLTVFVLLWCCTLGIILIIWGRTVPAADAMSVYSAAEALANGNTGVIHPTDSYLSYYPQQIGLVAFFEILIRIWHLLPFQVPAYHFIKCIYVLLTCVIILFQKRTVQLLWHDQAVTSTYLLLASLNMPLFMYSSFVYGEIPSFAAISGGIYFLLKLLQDPKAQTCSSRTAMNLTNIHSSLFYAFLSLLLLALGVMLRKNNLILMIAVLIVVIFQWIREKRHGLLIFALVCSLCCFSILPLVQKAYEVRAGSTLKTGVPVTSYFAMGMQEAPRGNGWYNGFNFNTYQSTGMDTEATNTISMEAIKGRLAYFKEHPTYAAKFYLYKHLSQWSDGTYACRQATLATFGGRSSLFRSLYEGPLSHYLIEYCNLFQILLYLGSAVFCTGQLLWTQQRYHFQDSDTTLHPAQAKTSGSNSPLQGLPLYLGLIGVIGGFLFHILWEANSRYIFLYALLLMPYCAKGLSSMYEMFHFTLHRHHPQ